MRQKRNDSKNLILNLPYWRKWNYSANIFCVIYFDNSITSRGKLHDDFIHVQLPVWRKLEKDGESLCPSIVFACRLNCICTRSIAKLNSNSQKYSSLLASG